MISLDFELHWGMRDHTAVDPAVTRMLTASRSTVEALAELFARREVHATWATVGLLFATTAAEARALSPATRPAYREARLDPYPEPIGPTEDEDPIHLAGSLVDRLAAIQGQELASHTFSHYYCLEPGPGADAFRADLLAAQAAAATRDLRLRSLVLPRNQWDPRLAPVLVETRFRVLPRASARLGPPVAAGRRLGPRRASSSAGLHLGRTRRAHVRLGRAGGALGFVQHPGQRIPPPVGSLDEGVATACRRAGSSRRSARLHAADASCTCGGTHITSSLIRPRTSSACIGSSTSSIGCVPATAWQSLAMGDVSGRGPRRTPGGLTSSSPPALGPRASPRVQRQPPMEERGVAPFGAIGSTFSLYLPYTEARRSAVLPVALFTTTVELIGR